MKLLHIEPLTNDTHKYKAVFEKDDGKRKTTKFGASGYTDYILSGGDKERRLHYRTRHAKDLETGDPTKAGFLSYYLLWGNSISLAKNISEYKKKFGL